MDPTALPMRPPKRWGSGSDKWLPYLAFYFTRVPILTERMVPVSGSVDKYICTTFP
jgi:hypothetical protein